MKKQAPEENNKNNNNAPMKVTRRVTWHFADGTEIWFAKMPQEDYRVIINGFATYWIWACEGDTRKPCEATARDFHERYVKEQPHAKLHKQWKRKEEEGGN